MVGAFAIAAALVRARSTGRGAVLDVSMLESMLSAMGWPVSNWLTTGTEPRPMGNDNMTAAPSGTFRTGARLLNIAANKQEQFEALARLIGRPDLATDPRFAEREARKANRAALTAEIEAGLASDAAEAWEKRLSAVGVPAGRVLTIPEVLAEPQVAARALLHRFDTVPGIDQPLTVLRGGFLVDGVAPAPQTPPPRLGQHQHEVLGP